MRLHLSPESKIQLLQQRKDRNTRRKKRDGKK